jgi:transposase
MHQHIEAHSAETVFDHDSTLVVALELSGKSWDVGALVPGVARRPRRGLEPRDMAGLFKALEGWKAEASSAGRVVRRVVLTYEAGRDGFWIARYLRDRDIEVHVMHPVSIPVPRRARRAKTDRIDLNMLLRTLVAWLRGEPDACSMSQIIERDEEDQRRPVRERERLISERIGVENRIENLLCLHGIYGFKPRLKKALAQLEELRCFDGQPLPPHVMAEIRRLMARHKLMSEQLRDLEAERDQIATMEAKGPAAQKIQLLARLVGLGVETATVLARELFYRKFKDRRALASFVGLTGTPFRSGGVQREQGISKTGNARVRRTIVQLAWRWLRFRPESELSRWFAQRTMGAKGRIRKVMIIALSRKLLITLWRYVETGLSPANLRFATAAVQGADM